MPARSHHRTSIAQGRALRQRARGVRPQLRWLPTVGLPCLTLTPARTATHPTSWRLFASRRGNTSCVAIVGPHTASPSNGKARQKRQKATSPRQPTIALRRRIPPSRSGRLWAVTKDKRILHCVARYLPNGIDLG